MIQFNKPLITGKELFYLQDLISKGRFCGDNYYTKLASEKLMEITGAKEVFLTTSCTHALEMAALLLDLKAGDEVILPSFTFVSTANAFLLRGVKLVFVDIDGNTMNIDPNSIRNAITKDTKAIVVVHYAGTACDMEKIMNISREYCIPVIEDAAQSVMSYWKNKMLGTIGDIGCYSFHETKNYHCGEGGAILINNPKFIERAHIIREKGTNRTKFLMGEIDKYSWVDIGSSFLLSDLNAAFLYSQLENAITVNEKRLEIWNRYNELLSPYCELLKVPSYAKNNGHLFAIFLKNFEERRELIQHLKNNGIQAVFHYLPLHNSEFGKKNSVFVGDDHNTVKYSSSILRLPMYYDLELKEVDFICDKVIEFMKSRIVNK